MKNMFLLSCTASIILSLLIFSKAEAQSPGLIVRRSSASSILDPNNDGYVSLPLNTGFTTNDISQSEIPFKVIPLAFTEPIGDLATGQSGSFTDLVVATPDKSGLMAYYNGSALIFRLRVGGISAGAKAYSILIDADFKAGNSGSQPDPNYVAPTAQGTGNIGFEWEVLLATGNTTTVTVNETDGKTGPNIVQAYSVSNSSNWQIATALTTNSNNPDYFYDFYVPLSAFTGTYAITSTTAFRMVATTVNSPTSALTGSRSDIFGVNDVNYTSTPEGWLAALGGTPPVTLTQLSSGSVAGTCTNPPVITSASVIIGSGQSISGTWSRRDAAMDANAMITVYRYSASGALLNTYPSTTAYPGGISSGSSWTITGITAASGDYFVAKAKGTSASLNESECIQSNIIYTTCASTINPTVLTQSGAKGICGSLTAGATGALIYKMDATGNTLMNPSNANTTYGAGTFSWFNCSGGTNNVANGTYMVILTGGGCQSTPVFDCISSGASSLAGLAVNTGITFPTAIYPFQTIISGSVPAFTGAQMATLFINNVQKATFTVPANATSYSFSGLQLNANDNIKVYLSGNGCTVYNSTSVVCYNQPPVINTDANGALLAGATSISGTAAPNASITVNKTNATINSWTTTANASGAWSVTVPALVAADTYTATVTAANGCNTASAASPTVTVASVTTTCPVISPTPVTNTPYTDTSTIVYGTVNVTTTPGTVRLYVDGALAGTQVLNATGSQTWSITSSLPFYNNALLKATFQSGTGGSEKTDCGTSTVVCTSPSTPSISPTSATIVTGQVVSYSVSNVVSSTWYAVQDNTGASYAKSIYTNSNSNITLATAPFPTAGTYQLRISADKLSGCASSTALATVVVNNATVPLRFISVSATNAATGVKVNWAVADEINVQRYVVERSYDGTRFEDIGLVAYRAAVTAINNYSFVDQSTINSGVLFYRIRQIDEDGHYSFSTVVAVTMNTASQSLQVWPNPAADVATVNISARGAQLAKLELVDVNGKSVFTKSLFLNAGVNSTKLDNLSRLPRGAYYLKAYVDKKYVHLKLIIK